MSSFSSSFPSITWAITMASIHGVSASYANQLPPDGAIEASCIYANQTPNFCKVKISPAKNTIWIWRPECRKGAMASEYNAICLNAVCILTGPN